MRNTALVLSATALSALFIWWWMMPGDDPPAASAPPALKSRAALDAERSRVAGTRRSILADVTVCGNGKMEAAEQCDDGNRDDGDGCSSRCRKEGGCGDGVLQEDEECDDGNRIDGDGCSNCKLSKCGKCVYQACSETLMYRPSAFMKGADESRIPEYPPEDLVGGCFALEGMAETGPGAGRLRSDLCADAVACMTESRCMFQQLQGIACYCGITTDDGSDEVRNQLRACMKGESEPAGPCVEQFNAAAETSNPTEVATRATLRGTPLGQATLLMTCGSRTCTEACTSSDGG